MMGYTLVRFTWSIATAYIIAVAVWPLLKCRAKRNLVGAGLAIIGISSCPALIPPENIMVRAFSCLLCIDPLFRVLDYARQLRKGTIIPVTWQAYWTFLIPFPFLLTVFGEKQQAKHTLHFEWRYVARLMVGLSAFAIAVFLCVQSHQVAALRESFLLDHLTKLLLFTIAVEMVSQAQIAFERLSGFYAVPIINHAYLARTPAEFWFRYNQRVRQWLYVNVFVPCGGRRLPLAGIIAVFLVSAIFHEFFFALATSRLDGYQFAFFMLQAPAVILSPRLERLAERGIGGRLAAHGLTWLWFAGTSPLFFHGLDSVFPFFYASQSWLP
jgi:Acyl-CoA cholesterol acyltransferase